jgi:predicted PurR-regulated permease PerM
LRIDLVPLLVVVGVAITAYELWGMLGVGIAVLVLGTAYAILDAISREDGGADD